MREKKDYEELGCYCCGSTVKIGVVIGENLNITFSQLKGMKFLVISFTSDWLYPTTQSKEIVKSLKSNGIEVSFVEIDIDYGHDSFLIECQDLKDVVFNFLNSFDI